MIFYVLVFGLLAIFVVVVGVMRMRGRSPQHPEAGVGSPTTAGDPSTDGASLTQAATHHHPTDAARRSRKAKRAESRRDRRKRK